MNRTIRLGLAASALALSSAAYGARATSDLLPPQRRQATVEIAERLTNRPPPAPLPEELISPFNPPGFSQRPAKSGTPVAAAPEEPAGPPSDRETLEMLAAQIQPTGMFHFRGKPLLLIGGKRFEIGTRFTATYNNEDYELELVAIESTSFTLRYRGEEITRPIQRR